MEFDNKNYTENKEAQELDFGGRVMELLEKDGLTQRELADAVHMTEATISRYLRNIRIPKGTVIRDIAKVLNVSCDFLLGAARETNGDLLPCPFCGASGEDIDPKMIYPTRFTKGMAAVECLVCGAMVIDTDPAHSVMDAKRKWNRRAGRK